MRPAQRRPSISVSSCLPLGSHMWFRSLSRHPRIAFSYSLQLFRALRTIAASPFSPAHRGSPVSCPCVQGGADNARGGHVRIETEPRWVHGNIPSALHDLLLQRKHKSD